MLSSIASPMIIYAYIISPLWPHRCGWCTSLSIQQGGLSPMRWRWWWRWCWWWQLMMTVEFLITPVGDGVVAAGEGCEHPCLDVHWPIPTLMLTLATLCSLISSLWSSSTFHLVGILMIMIMSSPPGWSALLYSVVIRSYQTTELGDRQSFWTRGERIIRYSNSIRIVETE